MDEKKLDLNQEFDQFAQNFLGSSVEIISETLNKFKENAEVISAVRSVALAALAGGRKVVVDKKYAQMMTLMQHKEFLIGKDLNMTMMTVIGLSLLPILGENQRNTFKKKFGVSTIDEIGDEDFAPKTKRVGQKEIFNKAVINSGLKDSNAGKINYHFN
jgi:hypothetical protein